MQKNPRCAHALRLAVRAALRQLAACGAPPIAHHAISLIIIAALLALAACHKAGAAQACKRTVAAPPTDGDQGRPSRAQGQARARRRRSTIPTGSRQPRRLHGQAGAGEPVGDLVRALRQGTADARRSWRATGRASKCVAVSQDDGPHASVVAFLKAHQIAHARTLSGPEDGACRARSGRNRAADVDPVRCERQGSVALCRRPGLDEPRGG